MSAATLPPRLPSRPRTLANRALALATAALLITVLAPASAAAWTAGTFSSASESQMIQLHNQARANAGLPALLTDGLLASEARARSKDMADRNYFSHSIPPDGHSVFTELQAMGYCYIAAGENIGWNTYPDDAATQVMMDSFMASSGHRSNILGSAWLVMGVGAYQAADGRKLWTVLFAQPCTPPPSPTPTPLPTPPPGTSGTYVPVTPTRILDTRTGNGLSGAMWNGVPRSFQVTDRAAGDASRNIPSTAFAVTGNLTATSPSAGGWLALTPVVDPTQSTSVLNVPAGDTRANGVTVPLGPGGTLVVLFGGAQPGSTVQVLFDVTGYFVPGSSGARYVPLRPARVLDTRTATGLAGASAAGTPRTFQVSGCGGVAANAVAITGTITVTAQTAGGWVFLGPVALPQESVTSSTINFPVGDDRANAVTVALGSGGTLSATYGGPIGSTVHLVLDVTGYFVPAGAGGAAYVPITPTRLLDTRSGNGLLAPFSAGTPRSFAVAGRGGVSAQAVALTGNLTVTAQTAGGWVFQGPDALAMPAVTSSTINFPLADDRANGVAVALASDGSLSATYGAPGGSTVQLIFDVTGYFIP